MILILYIKRKKEEEEEERRRRRRRRRKDIRSPRKNCGGVIATRRFYISCRIRR
jgi:hypothetical protein